MDLKLMRQCNTLSNTCRLPVCLLNIIHVYMNSIAMFIKLLHAAESVSQCYLPSQHIRSLQLTQSKQLPPYHMIYTSMLATHVKKLVQKYLHIKTKHCRLDNNVHQQLLATHGLQRFRSAVAAYSKSIDDAAQTAVCWLCAITTTTNVS